MITQEKIILGIDPGTTIMGFGLIKIVGSKMNLLQLNELKMQKYKDHYIKLKLIFSRTLDLIEEFKPCLSNYFLNSKRQRVYLLL